MINIKGLLHALLAATRILMKISIALISVRLTIVLIRCVFHATKIQQLLKITSAQPASQTLKLWMARWDFACVKLVFITTPGQTNA